MPGTFPCPKCKKPRSRGGATKEDGLCRLCWHKARMALPASLRKRGPNTGRSGKARPPRAKSPRIVSQPSAAEREAATTPVSAWWVGVPREGWRDAQDAQRERFTKIPVTAAEVRRDLAMSGLL